MTKWKPVHVTHVELATCLHCGAKPGEPCQDPRGYRVWPRGMHLVRERAIEGAEMRVKPTQRGAVKDEGSPGDDSHPLI